MVRFYQKLQLASLFLQLLEISHCCVDREDMLLTSGVFHEILRLNVICQCIYNCHFLSNGIFPCFSTFCNFFANLSRYAHIWFDGTVLWSVFLVLYYMIRFLLNCSIDLETPIIAISFHGIPFHSFMRALSLTATKPENRLLPRFPIGYQKICP